MRKEWRDNDTTTMMDKRQLRQALPEMSNTLSNWTLHGQNLGSMLDNYCVQCRNMKKEQRRELGHFFNTTSNILDTIGSMTENTILRSVKFDKDDKERQRGLVGGSIEKKFINNKLPTALFPNEENLSRYAAVFPGYSIDYGNMLDIGPSVDNQLFMADYPSIQIQKPSQSIKGVLV